MEDKKIVKLKDLSRKEREKIIDIIAYQMQEKIDDAKMRTESTNVPFRNIAIKLWDEVRRRAIKKFVFHDHKMYESQALFLLDRNKFIESIFAHMLEDQNFCDQFVDIIMDEIGKISEKKCENTYYINPDLLG